MYTIVKEKEMTDDIVFICKQHETLMGLPIKVDAIIEEQRYLFSKKNYTCYLVYKDDKIHSMFGCIQWSTMPYWLLCNLKTNPLYTKNIYKSGFQQALREAMIDMESQGYYRFYYFSEYKHSLGYHKIMIRNCPIIGRYQMVLEEKIPAGTRSLYSVFDDLAGNKVWDVDMAISSTSLLPQHRPM